MKSLNEIVEGFRSAMADAGVPFSGHITPDAGKITRFTVDGDRKQAMTGWYVLYSDNVAAGEFGCWKRGVQSKWCAEKITELTSEQRQLMQRRAEETAKKRAEETAERNAQAAQIALMMWDAASPCEGHPYLDRKGIKPHGVRVGKWVREIGDREVIIENALLVPVRDGKKLVGLQGIFPDKNNGLYRDKDYLPGAKKRGCFFVIGKDTSTIVICEGYATGASIHQATGFAVVVAFDAGNLRPVAERIRSSFPQSTLVIAADNDRWTKEPMENPGVHYGKQAAIENRAWLAVPEFDSLDSKPTDFNDLCALQGEEAVKLQITQAIGRLERQPEPESEAEIIPANDNTPAPVQARSIDITPDSIDWLTPLPFTNSTGKPTSTIDNLREMLRRMGVIVRYNVISKEEEILIPGESFSLDNGANASLAFILSWCGHFRMPTGQVGDFVTYLSDKNLYNPVANWITGKPWDGKSRLQAIYDTVKAEGDDQTLKETLMRRWFVSAIAGAFEPNGVSAHGVLVFQGGQYLGKTAWFKRLVPKELGVIADGLMLKPDDRDSVKQVVSNWLVELGELDATFRKSDIAQLKSFLTRDRDVLRRAYAKKESAFARRTVFFASVNPREFLHDPTGNRRYWTIECEDINHKHNIDMQQLWAEVYELYKQGEPWILSAEEVMALNDRNRAFEVIDPIQERIASELAWDDPEYQWSWRSATDVLLSIGIDRPTQSESTRAAAILRQMNGNRGKRAASGRVLLVPRTKKFAPGY